MKPLVLASVLLLSGCASVIYEPVTLDSPPPALGGLPAHETLPCRPALAPGQRCWALVRAQDWYSDTGIRVSAGQAYCIRIPPGQVWFDAGRRNSPPQGEPGSPLMNAFRFLKRHPEPWFTLMAAVVQGTDAGPQTSAALKPRAELQSQALSRDNRLLTTAAGTLVLYPNDARADRFYDNNHGQIWAQVEHLAGTQPCTRTVAP